MLEKVIAVKGERRDLMSKFEIVSFHGSNHLLGHPLNTLKMLFFAVLKWISRGFLIQNALRGFYILFLMLFLFQLHIIFFY
jgi:hypothetical protein